jgi:hypothetical protein
VSFLCGLIRILKYYAGLYEFQASTDQKTLSILKVLETGHSIFPVGFLGSTAKPEFVLKFHVVQGHAVA